MSAAFHLVHQVARDGLPHGGFPSLALKVHCLALDHVDGALVVALQPEGNLDHSTAMAELAANLGQRASHSLYESSRRQHCKGSRDRETQRAILVACSLSPANLLEDLLRARPRSIALVYERQPRHVVSPHLSIDRDTLRLHSTHGAQHENCAIQNAKSSLDLHGEVHVTWARNPQVRFSLLAMIHKNELDVDSPRTSLGPTHTRRIDDVDVVVAP